MLGVLCFIGLEKRCRAFYVLFHQKSNVEWFVFHCIRNGAMLIRLLILKKERKTKQNNPNPPRFCVFWYCSQK